MSYTLLLKLEGRDRPVLRQLDAKGNVLSEMVIETPFVQLNVAKRAKQMVLEGAAEVFEIITE